MKKKTNKVMQYLEELFEKDESRLKKIKPKEIAKLKRFKDISERTIRNALVDFKTSRGLIESREKGFFYKKSILERYLLKLLEETSPEEILSMKGTELLEVPELAGIGRTTIITGFTRFKKKYLPNMDAGKAKKKRDSNKPVQSVPKKKDLSGDFAGSADYQAMLSTIQSLNNYINVLEQTLDELMGSKRKRKKK